MHNKSINYHTNERENAPAVFYIHKHIKNTYIKKKLKKFVQFQRHLNINTITIFQSLLVHFVVHFFIFSHFFARIQFMCFFKKKIPPFGLVNEKTYKKLYKKWELVTRFERQPLIGSLINHIHCDSFLRSL